MRFAIVQGMIGTDRGRWFPIVTRSKHDCILVAKLSSAQLLGLIALSPSPQVPNCAVATRVIVPWMMATSCAHSIYRRIQIDLSRAPSQPTKGRGEQNWLRAWPYEDVLVTSEYNGVYGVTMVDILDEKDRT